MEKEKFNEMILNGNYMLWLSNFIEKYVDIDDIYFVHENKLSEEDIKLISCLEYLFLGLNKYAVKYSINQNNIFEYYLKYNESIYQIYYNFEGYSCRKVDETSSLSYIEYKNLRKEYRKNMEYNFEKLESRVINSLKNTDLEKINYELSKILNSTLISGVGGSSVVSEFATNVLNIKNNIITRNTEPYEFKYLNLNGYNNILSCSYSGNNYGVQLSFFNDLKHYLLSVKENNNDNMINLTYSNIDREHSFISLATTLIPCSILLNYYLDGKKENINLISELVKSYEYNFDVNCDQYEIFTGINTSTASKYLESTMVESGIGVPILHDKYSYCHGRSTMSINNNNIAIYFDTGKELDKLLLSEIDKYYKDIIVIKTDSSILGDYSSLVKSMYLTKYIAEQNKKDLSGVDYNPIVKKIYKYNGNL